MCGIFGAIALRPVQPILVEGLKRLEYRGYDSAGLVLVEGPAVTWVRAQGKVSELEGKLFPTDARQGIAHTRWATHGLPSEANAHPHNSGRFYVVHNGIIENFESLKSELIQRGYKFVSETDTEVIAHLLHCESLAGSTLDCVIWNTVKKLNGAFALAIVDVKTPNTIWAVRRGSPLVIGVGHDEHFVGSDQLALLHVTDRMIFLEDGDFARVERSNLQLFDKAFAPVNRSITRVRASQNAVTKNDYRHFMAKEIHEQPKAIKDTLVGRIANGQILSGLLGPASDQILTKVQAVQIVACGTSYHAGLVARYWIESLTSIPCQVEIGSEYRYRDVVTLPNTLWIAISQSGETADVLAALRHMDPTNICATLAVCNVPTSSLIRETDFALLTQAGPEIGVASTKAFTTQLVVLLILTGLIAKAQPNPVFDESEIVKLLQALPDLVSEALLKEYQVEQIAKRLVDKNDVLFLGRATMNPIAMEGALKLKELSYIHAEAYAAGELKHGPLALVDENMPVIAVAPNDELIEKLKSNLSEVKARGGQLIVFADFVLEDADKTETVYCVMPKTHRLMAPIVFTIPLQLLAYHVAVMRGTDVDQPRNLAKSVTVE